jgi:hypothetical protein
VTSQSGTKTVTRTATCPVGTVLLSGGGTVTTTDTLDKVELTSSYPSSTTTWTVVGSAAIGKGKTWSLRAYALCA